MSQRSQAIDPVFLVGAGRSGTTLLAAIFSAHSDYACGPETQFFARLDEQALTQAISDPSWPAKAVQAMQQLTLSKASVLELFGISAADLSAYLNKQPPSVQAMLEALTASFAARQGRPCWAEKTPNHLLHLSRIRKLYPDAPIVRILRDPRDAALSLSRLPWTSDSFVANCHMWNDGYRRSRAFFDTDHRCHTLRYEDLVQDPQGVLTRMCEAIGIEFQPSMLRHESSAPSVVTDVEPWKRGVTTAINAGRLEAWKKELPVELAHAGSLICHQAITEFGYSGAVQPRSELAYEHFTDTFIEQHEQQLVQAAMDDILIRGARDDDTLPTTINALLQGGRSRSERLHGVVALLKRVIADRWGKQPTRYLSNLKSHGLSEHLALYALKLLGKPVCLPSSKRHAQSTGMPASQTPTSGDT